MKSAVVGTILILLAGQTSFGQAESAQNEKPGVSSYVLCRNQKQVRTIRVNMASGTCRAVYSKEGKEEVVGRSGTSEKCVEIIQNIRTNLEKSNWKCEDVTPDRVSFSQE